MGTTEMMMIRWMCGISLIKRQPSAELRRRLTLGEEGIVGVTRRGRLTWHRHVERKDEADYVKACTSLVVERNDDVDYVKACTSLVVERNDDADYVKTCTSLVVERNDDADYVKTCTSLVVERSTTPINFVRACTSLVVERKATSIM